MLNNYYNASDATALTNALENIASVIENSLGYSKSS